MTMRFGLISPSSPIESAVIARTKKYFAQHGHDTVVAPHASAVYFDVAGTVQQRVDDIHSMFADQSIDAVFATRGGYGSPQLLAELDYDMIATNKKPLFGFSDTTALQLALYTKSGLKSYSGFLPSTDLSTTEDGTVVCPSMTERDLWQTLPSKAVTNRLTFSNQNAKVIKSGTTHGTLIGGCLSLVSTLIGTPYLPDMKGKILLLEEVGEAPYRIDRLLQQLYLSGILGEISGLMFGTFHNCHPSEPNDLPLQYVLNLAAQAVNGPVLSHYNYGHIPNRRILPIGGDVHITA